MKVNNIKHPRGKTPTCQALKASLGGFKNSSRFNDKDTTKVLITLTDGE